MASRSKTNPQWLNNEGANLDLVAQFEARDAEIAKKLDKAQSAANRIMVSGSSSPFNATLAGAITASRALVSNASGIPTASNVTSTQLGYVAGVTSSIQDQLDSNRLPYYACVISGNTSPLGIPFLTWVGSVGNYYSVIPYGVHKKGLISRPSPSVDIYLPKVKTYSYKNNSVWEETYDSPVIDILTGNVTVYSNVNTPDYLVIIY